jgi:hypothetical protein
MENTSAEEWRREEQAIRSLGVTRADVSRLLARRRAGYDRHRVGPGMARGPARQPCARRARVDTGTALVGDEWGKDFKTSMKYLRSLALRHQLAVVVLVHLTKPPRDRQRSQAAHGTSLSDVMGQWTRSADAVALMADLGEGRIRWTMRKRVPHSSLVIAQADGLFRVVAVTEDRATASTDDRILRAIAAGASAPDEIRIALGSADRPIPKRTFFDAMARLRTDGYVEDGTPYRLTRSGTEAAA